MFPCKKSRTDTGGTKPTASVARSLLPTSETREQVWYRSATESEVLRDGRQAVLAYHTYRWLRKHTEPGRWGTEIQGTHWREGEAGHNVFWRELWERLRAHKPYHRSSRGLRCTDSNSYAPNGERHLFGSPKAKAIGD